MNAQYFQELGITLPIQRVGRQYLLQQDIQRSGDISASIGVWHLRSPSLQSTGETQH